MFEKPAWECKIQTWVFGPRVLDGRPYGSQPLFGTITDTPYTDPHNPIKKVLHIGFERS